MKSNCLEITPLPLGKPPRVLPSRGELLESPFEGGALTKSRWGMSKMHKELIEPLWNSNIHTPLPQKTTVGPPLFIEGTYMSPFEGGARFIGWGMSEKAKTKISLPNTVGIEMTLNL